MFTVIHERTYYDPGATRDYTECVEVRTFLGDYDELIKLYGQEKIDIMIKNNLKGWIDAGPVIHDSFEVQRIEFEHIEPLYTYEKLTKALTNWWALWKVEAHE